MKGNNQGSSENEMEQEQEAGWRSYVPGLALVMSVVGALLAAGGLIQKVNTLETRSQEQEREMEAMRNKQEQMMGLLQRIDERTKRLAGPEGGA